MPRTVALCGAAAYCDGPNSQTHTVATAIATSGSYLIPRPVGSQEGDLTVAQMCRNVYSCGPDVVHELEQKFKFVTWTLSVVRVWEVQYLHRLCYGFAGAL